MQHLNTSKQILILAVYRITFHLKTKMRLLQIPDLRNDSKRQSFLLQELQIGQELLAQGIYD